MTRVKLTVCNRCRATKEADDFEGMDVQIFDQEGSGSNEDAFTLCTACTTALRHWLITLPAIPIPDLVQTLRGGVDIRALRASLDILGEQVAAHTKPRKQPTNQSLIGSARRKATRKLIERADAVLHPNGRQGENATPARPLARRSRPLTRVRARSLDK